MPDRRWNRADFEAVARAHHLSDAEVADLFPKRRTSEIGRLRETLHLYHASRRRIIPDDSMAAHLARLEGQLVCHRCSERY